MPTTRSKNGRRKSTRRNKQSLKVREEAERRKEEETRKRKELKKKRRRKPTAPIRKKKQRTFVDGNATVFSANNVVNNRENNGFGGAVISPPSNATPIRATAGNGTMPTTTTTAVTDMDHTTVDNNLIDNITTPFVDGNATVFSANNVVNNRENNGFGGAVISPPPNATPIRATAGNGTMPTTTTTAVTDMDHTTVGNSSFNFKIEKLRAGIPKQKVNPSYNTSIYEDIQFSNSCIQYKRYEDNNQFFNVIKYFIKPLQVNFFKILHLSLGIELYCVVHLLLVWSLLSLFISVGSVVVIIIIIIFFLHLATIQFVILKITVVRTIKLLTFQQCCVHGYLIL
jgi:hypothetical protein